jgi:hypothetical protein
MQFFGIKVTRSQQDFAKAGESKYLINAHVSPQHISEYFILLLTNYCSMH